MNTSRHYGFTILLLVMFISSLSGFASKINGSKSGQVPKRGKEEEPLCALHNPTKSGTLFSPYCLEGYIITEIKFADYGQPTGLCDTFKRGNCSAPATLGLVKKNCLRKRRCRLFVTDEMFGPTHCKGPVSLAFLAICKKT